MAEAIDILEEYWLQTKNLPKLDELINYLDNHRAYIPNYRDRRAQRHYIGSAHVEKGNDLIVARRQKQQSMHWSEATSDGLAALHTLLIKGAGICTGTTEMINQTCGYGCIIGPLISAGE